MKNNGKWSTLSSRKVYSNQFIEVVEDQVTKPDGSKGIYGFVKVPGTVGVVAIDDKSNILLCKQYRYIFREDSWEIPRGFVERNESSLEAARRELAEEAGVKCKTIRLLGSLRLSIGLIDEEAKIYIARGLTSVLSKDEEISDVKSVSLENVLKMIKSQEITDGLTVSAILLAKEVANL